MLQFKKKKKILLSGKNKTKLKKNPASQVKRRWKENYEKHLQFISQRATLTNIN